MSEIDLNYLATSLSNLCGLPVRIYENRQETFFCSFLKFPKDPFILDKERVLPLKNNVGYYMRDDFFYYGYLNYGNRKLIIGPVKNGKMERKDINKIALDLNLEKDDYPQFHTAMSLLVAMPLSSILLSLCSFSHVLNGDKIALSDIIKKDVVIENPEPVNTPNATEHNTIDIENKIRTMVKNGSVHEYDEWLKNVPAIRAGEVSSDYLRQTKDIFIVTTTLVSRSAIEGGLNVNESLSLSDMYIQKVELMDSALDITNMQQAMIRDFMLRVHQIRSKDVISNGLLKLNKYIVEHISDPIRIEEVCTYLALSKSSLNIKIKDETGYSLNNYILHFKIHEAKRLIREGDSSMSSIAYYLGFSSQAHFTKTFKNFAGMTPLEYKNKI